MYDLPHFKAGNDKEVLLFMQAHPFVTLCGCGTDGMPVATHIPVLIEERNNTLFLKGHLMRGQMHTEAVAQHPQVLTIFSSGHSYVSASWYTQQNVASTWNYMAVHAQGTLRFLGDEDLYRLLVELTEKYEGAGSPSLVQQMKPGYVTALMKYIVAIEIEITKLEHVFKLSQNQNQDSFASIKAHLSAMDDAGAIEMAAAMEARNK